jgi:ribosomal protein L11 methyltransferase
MDRNGSMKSGDGVSRSRPSDWLAISVQAPPPGQLHLLAHALLAAGGRGLESDDGGKRVVAYFPPPTGKVTFMAELRAAIRSATGDPDPWLEARWISEDELSGRWRGGLDPRRVSSRIRIVPVDEAAAPAAGRAHGEEIQIRLTPGPAFGQGDHPTTLLALSLLDGTLTPGERVLDLGTGSGILAIAAARLGARHVLAVESDGPSVIHARRNVELNGLAGVVEVRELLATPDRLRSLVSRSDRLEGDFAPALHDGLMANLEPQVLGALLPAAADVLRRSGWLLVTGIPRGEVPGLRSQIDRLGLEVSREREEGGWWAGLLGTGRGHSGPRS